MKKLLITLAAISLIASGATAEVLWDQSGIDATFSVYDSESGCGGMMGSTIHAADDFMVGDQVTVEQITTYYGLTSGDMTWLTQAYLSITPKTGTLPTEDPHVASYLVPITVSVVDPGDGGPWYHEVVAAGLSIALMPGEYWVSLTPANYSAGPAGPNYHYGSTMSWGNELAIYEFCGMFGDGPWVNYFNPGHDFAFKIEGSIDVVANEDESWSNLKALYR